MKKIFYIMLCAFVCSCASAGENLYADASERFAEAMCLRVDTAAAIGDTGDTGDTGEVAAPASPDAAAEKAAALFTEAADLFETAAREDWRFWFEAGNARWWAGDGAGAVIAYRRYLARDPFNPRVWQNLGSARRLAGTIPPANEGFLGWPWKLWSASLAAFLAGASLLLFSLFLFFRKPSFRTASSTVLACAAVAALLCAGAVLLSRPAAVILCETQGRMGDSAMYTPLPAEPLKPGQEVRILGSRDTWSRVRVGSVECWVPSETLNVID